MEVIAVFGGAVQLEMLGRRSPVSPIREDAPANSHMEPALLVMFLLTDSKRK